MAQNKALVTGHKASYCYHQVHNSNLSALAVSNILLYKNGRQALEKSKLLLLYKLEMASPSPNKSEQRERGIKTFPAEKRNVAGTLLGSRIYPAEPHTTRGVTLSTGRQMNFLKPSEMT